MVSELLTKIKEIGVLKPILECILCIGNFMNHGTRNGSALAFDPDYLRRIHEFRSTDNRSTMMHQLSLVWEQLFEENSISDGLMEMLERLPAVQRFDLASADENIKKQGTTLEELQVWFTNEDAVKSEQVKQVFGPFLQDCNQKFQELKKQFVSLQRDIRAACKFLCAEQKWEELLETLQIFKDALIQARHENKTHINKDSGKISRILQGQEHVKQVGSLMDALLETLKQE